MRQLFLLSLISIKKHQLIGWKKNSLDMGRGRPVGNRCKKIRRFFVIPFTVCWPGTLDSVGNNVILKQSLEPIGGAPHKPLARRRRVLKIPTAMLGNGGSVSQ